MLKVDLRKAFDSVRWDFIIATLKALSIPEQFINWIVECISTPSFSVSVNGVSGGFFHSTRGVRQGDPLSPYLFVLAMESLSRLLQSRFDSGWISYHPKTAELNISHLMFADDVMIFFDGSTNSLHGVSECLDDFSSWSGLVVNTEKTELFTSGLSPTDSMAIARFGFPSGTLPVRYLGLPLSSRKLKISEYAPLIAKITTKFRMWASRSLSFSGRLVLLSSVIAGLVSFWISAFVLPKGCIRQIESLCTRFLWSGNIDTPKMAKVAWSTVCLPKDEGGLGLRSFLVWNHVLCLRFIWLLFSESDSLWVAWHRKYHLQNKSFWVITESQNDSWMWKRLLKLRPVAKSFCKAELGDGRKISFWFDVWTQWGSLIDHIGERGPVNTRVRLHAKVCDAATDSGWCLGGARSQEELNLQIYLTTVPLPTETNHEDKYVWETNGTSSLTFSSALTWEVLRPRSQKKDWADKIWFKGAVPKFSFTMWIATLDRLPTRMRLASWGLQMPTSCCLCSASAETRDHLLLSCPFSFEIWRLIYQRLSPATQQHLTWAELLSWLRGSPKDPQTTLRRLAAQTTIFHLWRQRNNVLHNQISISTDGVFRFIDRDIRSTITARRANKLFSSLMSLWLR